MDGSLGSLMDAWNTIAIAREAGAKWVAIDGYHFDSTFQKTLKDEGFQVLVMDDFGHASFYWADLVVNQNSSTVASWYKSRSDSTRLLLGPNYLLLRKEFITRRGLKERERPSPGALNLLVTFGGSDPANLTETVLTVLAKADLPNVGQIIVLVGDANPHLARLRVAIRD